MSDKIIKIGDKYLSINGDYELVENMSAATRFDDLENLEVIPMTIPQGAIIHDLLDWVVISVNEKEIKLMSECVIGNIQWAGPSFDPHHTFIHAASDDIDYSAAWCSSLVKMHLDNTEYLSFEFSRVSSKPRVPKWDEIENLPKHLRMAVSICREVTPYWIMPQRNHFDEYNGLAKYVDTEGQCTVCGPHMVHGLRLLITVPFKYYSFLETKM